MFYTQIANTSISRFIIGSNPFAGISHQGHEVDTVMRAYFTHEKVVDTLREAESLGINTVIARADDNTLTYLKRFWEGGGKLRWFSQTCPELGDPAVSIERAAAAGAIACYIHGGVMDNLLANHGLSMLPDRIRLIHERGMLAGIAAHNPAVFRWAEESGLDVDFYMCAYYNPTPRDQNAAHVHGAAEVYLESDRQAMTATIRALSKPAIHYKILAAGRNEPGEAFAYAARAMRPQDALCVGVYPQGQPGMLAEDVRLFQDALHEM
jgi:hypothetical protein